MIMVSRTVFHVKIFANKCSDEIISLYMKWTVKGLPFKFECKLYIVYNKDNINEKEAVHNGHTHIGIVSIFSLCPT